MFLLVVVLRLDMHLPNKAKYIFATEFDDLKNVFRAIPGMKGEIRKKP